MNPIQKLKIISLGIIAIFLFSTLINKITKNLLYVIFVKLRQFIVFLTTLFPFYWYFKMAGKDLGITFFGKSFLLGDSRFYFLGILLNVLVFSSILFFIVFFIKKLLKLNNIFLYIFVITFFVANVITMNNNTKIRKSLPIEYPPYYGKQRMVMDRTNLYAFDENGIRLTYNPYLVDVIKFFFKNDVKDMWYWLVSKYPSSGIYEAGLLQRMLMIKDHRVEGVVVTDVETKKDSPEEIMLRSSIILFAEHIMDIERASRYRVISHKNRYLIVDNYFPSDTIQMMDYSSFFQKVYQNKLYKVYKLKNP